jgi:adenylate kinase
MLPNIHLIGIQGSGKGTQAACLVSAFDLLYLGSGNLFRQRAMVGDAYGAALHARLCSGTLLPDEDLERVVTDFLRQANLKRGVVADGVIRTLSQYHALQAIWEPLHLDQPRFFHLSMPDEYVATRIAARKATQELHAHHHATYSGKLIHRDDDNPRALKERVALFHTMTEPVITKATSEGRCITIDATQPITDVHSEIRRHLTHHYPSFLA